MKRAHGFTLIELMVAVGLSSIIGIAAAAAATSIIKDFRRNEELVHSHDRTKTLMDLMISRAQAAGGGGLRPWTSLQVYDDAATSTDPTLPADIKPGTDVLAFIVPDPTLSECQITAHNGANLVSPAGGSPAACCLTPAHENRALTIVTAGGDVWGTQIAANVHSGPLSCDSVDFPPGQAFGATDNKLPGTTDADFVNGFIVATGLVRFYVNTSDQLIMEDDSDGDGVRTPFVVSDRVFDLQVALGYDVDADGDLTETGGANDEWLGNSTGDAFGSGGLNGATIDQLRMSYIGLTVGTRMVGHNSSAQLLNGPTMAANDTILRSTTSRAYLRNLNIFF